MSLRFKFNLILILTTIFSMLAAGSISYTILMRDAHVMVQRSAEMLLGGALAVRKYTVEEIRPLLDTLENKEFLPQTVPAYAATQVIHRLQADNPEYTYKEAALNPTNPANRATDWEADIINWFRTHPDAKELVGDRQTATGSSLYISRPIRITNPNCLSCHSDPATAPATVTARYGTTNGFGWKLNEIIGAQIVSVPEGVQKQAAWNQFLIFMGSLLGIFVVTGIVLNILLYRFVTRPVAKIAAHAEKVSTSNDPVDELEVKGKDEIASLARSFNRMQRSLSNAVKLLDNSLH